MNTDYSFSGIRIFISVVEAGSFSRAAKVLNLSSSAVSKSIANLEDRLGVVVFQRTTRQLKLTTEGEHYYESCVRAFQELKSAEENLRSNQSLKGRVRLDLPVVYGKKWILPIVMNLYEKYPEINFEVTFSNQRVDLIDEDVDLVIRIGELDIKSSHRARLLGRQGILICASPQYLKKKGTPQTLTDLEAHECITESNSGAWLVATAEGKTKKIQVPGRLRLEGADSCLQAALAGKGLAQLPSWLAEEHLRSGDLVAVLDTYATSLPIHAVWIKTQQKTEKKIRIVLDELIKSGT